MEQYMNPQGFRLSPETGYFTREGVDVIAFEDIYPEGHQGGVSLLMHGERIAANGVVRFEPAPGQWQPVPLQLERSVSFASGIGAESVTAAYGFNRADASYIPGGVVSGTALIRPDFPELKDWPYLWQQTEYVLGGGSSRFMFLVLAVQDLMRHPTAPALCM